MYNEAKMVIWNTYCKYSCKIFMQYFSHVLIVFYVLINSITLNKLTYIYTDCPIGIDLRNMILKTTQ